MTAAAVSYCLILALSSSASKAYFCNRIFLRLRRHFAETRFIAKRFSRRIMLLKDVLLVFVFVFVPVHVLNSVVLAANASLIETETAACPKEECDC